MENKKTFGHLAALLTIVIWGTTFISTKILLVDFKPVEILFFRFVMGFMILLAISPKWLKTKSRKEEGTFVLAGLCGICLYYLLENIALTYTLASNVGVIISVAPFFTAIAAHLFIQYFVFGIGSFCALLCDMEFCSKRVRRGKDKRLYLYGPGNKGYYFHTDFA